MVKVTSLEQELVVKSVDHNLPLSLVQLSGTYLVNTYWGSEIEMERRVPAGLSQHGWASDKNLDNYNVP